MRSKRGGRFFRAGRLRVCRNMNETSKMCVTGATREDEVSDPSRFSRKPRANNEVASRDVGVPL
jgi:hypothetical protein